MVLINTLLRTESIEIGVLRQNERIYDFNDFSPKAPGHLARCISIIIITANGCWALAVCQAPLEGLSTSHVINPPQTQELGARVIISLQKRATTKVTQLVSRVGIRTEDVRC